MYHISCIICESSLLKTLKRYSKDYICKCSNCGMFFSKKIATDEELLKLYKTNVTPVESYISPITLSRYKSLLLKFEKVRETNRILDFGCGNGEFLEVAKSMGWDVYGTEYSTSSVEILKNKNIPVVSGNFTETAFPYEYFDVITSFEVLEHLVYPMQNLNLMFNWLRKGGYFYATTPNFNSIGRCIMRVDILYPEHISLFSRKTLIKALQSIGFYEINMRSEGIQLHYFSNKAYQPLTTCTNNESKDEQLRKTFEKNYVMKYTKIIINNILNALDLGFTLKVLAKKN